MPHIPAHVINTMIAKHMNPRNAANLRLVSKSMRPKVSQRKIALSMLPKNFMKPKPISARTARITRRIPTRMRVNRHQGFGYIKGGYRPKNTHPNNMRKFRGYNTIQQALNSFGVGYGSERHKKKYLKNITANLEENNRLLSNRLKSILKR